MRAGTRLIHHWSKDDGNPGLDLILDNADAWWASKDQSAGLNWTDRIASIEMQAGSSSGADGDDPTFVSGTPNALSFDGTSEDATASLAAGQTPAIDSGSGSYTILLTLTIKSGIATGDRLFGLFSGTPNYIGVYMQNATTMSFISKDDAGIDIEPAAVSVAADDQFTVVMTIEDGEMYGHVVKNGGAVVSTLTETLNASTYGTMDDLWLASYIGISNFGVVEFHDVALFKDFDAFTSADVLLMDRTLWAVDY